ncbi:hypothetical protein ACFE04_006300 [Oxalis oulophora]
MDVKGYPLHVDVQPTIEPSLGLEFNSANEAREFYALYAKHVGFQIRSGQLYRSKGNGSVSSRRFVCSKEGFQLSSRTGCPALIRVKTNDSGKWVIDQIEKNHNHDFGPAGESRPFIVQERSPTPRPRTVDLTKRRRTRLQDDADYVDGSKDEDGQQQLNVEPYLGLQFNSADHAYQLYQAYAESNGFRIRIGQLFRSNLDGTIASRRFVCSKEGHQHPSRLGCGAFMKIKKQENGIWVVDRLQKDHNHDLGFQVGQIQSPIASTRITEDFNGGLDSLDSSHTYNYLGIKTYEEGDVRKFSVQKCGQENENYAVTFSISNLNVSCSCRMFESEGVSSKELKNMMVWSLKEAASKYIEFGTLSHEKYKLAFEIMREGVRKLSWRK